MKFITLQIILICIYSLSNAQMEKVITYGTAQQESSSSILPLPDGTFVIGARSANNRFELLHIKENGLIINQVQFESTRSITHLQLLNDNTILVVGSEGNSENNGIVILKLDLGLNIIWSKILQSTHMVYAYGAKQVKNNDIVITGYSSLDGTANSNWDCLMLRIDPNGNLLWKKVVRTSDTPDWLLDFVELPNGNLVFVGASYVSSVDFLLIKTDKSGNILKTSTFGGSLNEVIYSVLLVNNKLILNAGTWSFGFGEYDFVFAKCDTNFNIETTKIYGGNKFDFPFCSSYENNVITIAGYSKSFNNDSNNDIVLFSFDQNGNLIKSIKVGLAGSEISFTKGQLYTKTATHTYITGETSSYGNGMSDIFFARINNTINNCCEFFTDIAIQQTNITLNTSSLPIITQNTGLNTFLNFSSNRILPTNYDPKTNCNLGPLGNSITLNNTTTCTNTPLTFNSSITSTGFTYYWNFGDPSSGSNNTSNNDSPSHTYTSIGNYTVQLIVSDGCSSDTDTLVVNIKNGIDINTQITSNSNLICQSDTIKFNSTTNDPSAKYSWNFNDPASGADNFSTNQNPSHAFEQAGQYDVLLITYNDCFTDSDRITINVTGNIPANFNYLIDTCLGIVKLTTTLTGNIPLNWYLDNVMVNTDTNPSLSLINEGYYTIKLISNPNTKCADTLEQTINYSNDKLLQGIQIPNVFTPNNDGINDYYELDGNADCKVKKMIIFNRWGQKIMESTTNIKWDGKNNNQNCPEGTYILYLEYNNEKVVKTINLLR